MKIYGHYQKQVIRWPILLKVLLNFGSLECTLYEESCFEIHVVVLGEKGMGAVDVVSVDF